ncbi:TetR/AcrR family transcriptional regulator [Metabacillus fastidiosus]|uniref:TetR/AcrR family transcriptional regulator n=1 Tax=Metabacillus fastidiosus TaxID=1458 RepID=UPI003D2CFD4F
MTKSNRKKELKEQIYLKAMQLFKEKGYEKVTVQEIADTCGIAKGTFFNYFAKKDDILLYLGISQIEYFVSHLNELEDHTSLKEQIESILGDLLQRFLDYGEIMKLAVLELIKSDYLIETESKSIAQLQHYLVEIIEKAINNGTFRSKWDAETIASTIMGIYFSTLITAIMKQNVNTKELFQQNLNVIWEGISQK